MTLFKIGTSNFIIDYLGHFVLKMEGDFLKQIFLMMQH